ncbi:transposon Tf2-9 polyprotein [Elysia marginata]|uniref:Transposon Tf2-9 polyprotein n=1 Tax=Elysia marginata TaxID=1093978 RepID=A0AAV4GKP0_9GAST|nr:transposon Tf2-9 polyprotein [Elysia marginata]
MRQSGKALQKACEQLCSEFSSLCSSGLGLLKELELDIKCYDRGLLFQQRLPFGITSAPRYFQQIVDQPTSYLPGVAVYIDDILVNDGDAESHLKNLRSLLQRLDEIGLRCRIEKCEFAQPSFGYLGHITSREGISKGSKVDAVANMTKPTKFPELRGQIQFYGKFLPNLSTVLETLFQLTKKEIP